MPRQSLLWMKRRLARFRRGTSGATSIEYALVAVGIAVAVATTVYGVGTALDVNFFQAVLAAFDS